MQYNALDRSPIVDVDPLKVKPMPSKVMVKRGKGKEKHGKIIIPGSSDKRNPVFEGEVVALGDSPPIECDGLSLGDFVWFHYAVGPEDSAFFKWRDESYALIPYESILGVKIK